MVHTSKQPHRIDSQCYLPPNRILDGLPASSVILIMAVSCCPILACAEGLDRTAVSISVPSTMSSERLVKLTYCTVSPDGKVTTWLVIGVKSACPEVNVGITNHSWFTASFTSNILHYHTTNNNTPNFHYNQSSHSQDAHSWKDSWSTAGSYPKGGTRQVDIVFCGLYTHCHSSSLENWFDLIAYVLIA